MPSWVYAAGEPRYFATQGDAYLFGRLRAQSLGLTLRATYTFTPQLTLQAYSQLFLDAGHYSSHAWFPANGKGTVMRLGDLRPVTFAVADNLISRAAPSTRTSSCAGSTAWARRCTLFIPTPKATLARRSRATTRASIFAW